MRILHIVGVVIVLILSMRSMGAEVRVSNREPVPGEVGYRPADGDIAALNPPSFIWLHENVAKTYDVQWATNEKLEGAVTVEGFAWNTYTHHEPLKAGTYTHQD